MTRGFSRLTRDNLDTFFREFGEYRFASSGRQGADGRKPERVFVDDPAEEKGLGFVGRLGPEYAELARIMSRVRAPRNRALVCTPSGLGPLKRSLESYDGKRPYVLPSGCASTAYWEGV